MNKRLWCKALSWNMLATIVNCAVIILCMKLMPDMVLNATVFAIAVSLLERVVKIVVYVYHEKLWTRDKN